MKTPNDTESPPAPTPSGDELDCPDLAGYASVPPYRVETLHETRDLVIIDGNETQILFDYETDGDIDERFSKMEWVARCLTDCALAERDGDNLHNSPVLTRSGAES